MMYPVKVTHSISLLLNLKAYKFAHYYKNCGEWYVDAHNEMESRIIATLEYYQEGTSQAYNELANLIKDDTEL